MKHTIRIGTAVLVASVMALSAAGSASAATINCEKVNGVLPAYCLPSIFSYAQTTISDGVVIVTVKANASVAGTMFVNWQARIGGRTVTIGTARYVFTQPGDARFKARMVTKYTKLLKRGQKVTVTVTFKPVTGQTTGATVTKSTINKTYQDFYSGRSRR